MLISEYISISDILEYTSSILMKCPKLISDVSDPTDVYPNTNAGIQS